MKWIISHTGTVHEPYAWAHDSEEAANEIGKWLCEKYNVTVYVSKVVTTFKLKLSTQRDEP